MLTRKQHELLMFIDQHLRDTGFSPSFEEMKEALKLRSKSGIHRLITALEERGFLKRRAHRARALEVLRLPEAVQARAEATRGTAGASPLPANVIRGNFSGASAANVRKASPDTGAVMLPLYGRIAAGQPIEALRDQGSSVEVPAALLASGEHYALEVSGDSMTGIGIMDRDTVIIRRGDVAESGDVVVALVDDTEVTLKTLRRHRNSVALEAANPSYETRIFGPDRVKVQGKLIGLLRRY